MKNLFLSVLFLLSLSMIGFAAFPKSADKKPLALKNANITISANIFYGNEDEMKTPISAKFYLLRKSLVKILKDRDFQPVDEDSNLLTSDEAFLEATARALTEKDEQNALLSLLIEDLINKNQIAAVNTNLFGRGKINALKTGNYYLFGFARVEGEVFVWNFPVRLKRGQTHVEIDQYNADAVIEVGTLN